MSTEISDEALKKITGLLLDAIAAIVADDEQTANCMPTKAVMVYEFAQDDGSLKMNVFGTDGIWTAEAIGFLEMGKHDLLNPREDEE